MKVNNINTATIVMRTAENVTATRLNQRYWNASSCRLVTWVSLELATRSAVKCRSTLPTNTRCLLQLVFLSAYSSFCLGLWYIVSSNLMLQWPKNDSIFINPACI